MQGLGCQAIICQTGSIKELIHLQRETGPVMSPSRQERGREMEIRLLGSQLTASFRSLWHPNSKGPVPFGAIYLYMGTTPNPAYIQFLHYGEQDGGGHINASSHAPLDRQPFYLIVHITGSLGTWSIVPGTRVHMKIQNETLCKGHWVQREAQRKCRSGEGPSEKAL